jgi:hypothetical protein
MNLEPFLITERLMLPSLEPYEVEIGEKADFLINIQLVEPGKVEKIALSASNIELYESAYASAVLVAAVVLSCVGSILAATAPTSFRLVRIFTKLNIESCGIIASASVVRTYSEFTWAMA